MLFDLKTFLRPHILTLTPYASARDEYAGREGVFLDANENPIGSVTAQPYNRYPDPLQVELKGKVAQIKGVQPNQIFLGNGSDEAIDLLIRAGCAPGQESILINPPTYGMYEVSASINEVPVLKVPLTEGYQLDPVAVLAAVTPTTKIIFLCSPNNPTGNVLDPEAMRTVIRGFAGLVVVDEAYVDFAPHTSLLPELNEFPNLVVLQTFSKAWGLAALRLGMAFGDPELIKVLNKIKPPYNINGPTQELALVGLTNLAAKDEMTAATVAERERLRSQLLALPVVEKVHPSDASFLLVQVRGGRQVYEHLIRNQVIVRDRSSVKYCEGCLRVSVGTPEENQALLQALAKV